MLRHRGCELGSWVPETGSARVGRVMHRGVSDRAVLELYGLLVREIEGRGL